MNNKLKEKLQDISEITIETGAPVLGDMLSNALIGQAIPGAATAVLSYKQKKTERMLIKTIDELKGQINEINSKLKCMKKEELIFVQETLIPIVLDNIEKELQEEKIKYITNGISTSISTGITDIDLILSYYDILNKLRIIDINILINLYEESKKISTDCAEDMDMQIRNEYEATEMYIVKKLEYMGVISVRKTFDELEGSVIKPRKSAINISELGIYIIEFFKINKEKDEDNE